MSTPLENKIDLFTAPNGSQRLRVKDKLNKYLWTRFFLFVYLKERDELTELAITSNYIHIFSQNYNHLG